MPADEKCRISKSGRLGFGRACINCRQKKHRCDAGRPQCSGCHSRGLDCKYPVRFVGGQEQNNLASTSIDVPRSTTRTDNFCISQDQDKTKTLSNSGHNHENSSCSTGASAELPENQPSEPTGYFGDSSAFKFASELHGELDRLSPVTDDNTSHNGMNGVNHAKHAASSAPADLYDALPPRHEANELVDAYFERVHLMYPFMHEPSFRHQYECLWDSRRTCSLAWLALANMVFAYGCEFSQLKGHAERSELASTYVERAKGVLLHQVFKDVNLELAQGLLLLCNYLQGALELNECWNLFGLAIRSTVAIGLHIDPANDDGSSPVTRESRRRLWWGCFVLDRTLSMKFGRPPSIILSNALEVGLPLEVDDQYIVDSAPAPRQPGGRPSRTSLFVQTIKLSFVIDNILDKLYLRRDKSRSSSEQLTVTNDEHATLGNILLLDGHLQTWWDKVPLHLKVAPETSDGIDGQRQRNVIYLRYLQMRLLLQRPSLMLLAKPAFQDQYLRSVAMASAMRCIGLAKETILLISSQHPQQSLNSVWYLLHYVFSSLGVLFTAQSLNLNSPSDLATGPDTSTLTIGMAFLRSVSEYSVPARRYVILCEKYQRTSQETAHTSASEAVSVGLTIDSMYHALTPLHDQNQPNFPPVAMEQAGIPYNLEAGLDFTNIHIPDPNEFLFGLGLPQEFLTTDWSLLDSRPN